MAIPVHLLMKIADSLAADGESHSQAAVQQAAALGRNEIKYSICAG